MLEGEIEAESLNLGVVLRHQYERLIPDERIFLDILDGFRHTKDIDDFPDHIDISFLGVFCWKIGNWQLTYKNNCEGWNFEVIKSW